MTYTLKRLAVNMLIFGNYKKWNVSRLKKKSQRNQRGKMIGVIIWRCQMMTSAKENNGVQEHEHSNNILVIEERNIPVEDNG